LKQPRPQNKPAAPALQSAETSTVLTSNKAHTTFWLILIFFIGAGLVESHLIPFDSLLAYYLVLSACLLPAGLWAYNKSFGMPIYPCFCAFQFLAFGLPLITQHKGVYYYPAAQHLNAAASFFLSVNIGTLCWLIVSRQKTTPPPHYLKINVEGGDKLLLCFMFLSLFFNMNAPFQWVVIPWKYLSLLQPFCNGLSTLAAFILSYRIGSGKTNRTIQILFIIILVCNTIMMNATLFLFLAIPSLALALAGYALGKHKIPWVSGIFALGLTYFLHAGKNEMRIFYWDQEKNTTIKHISDVLPFYEKWTNASWKELNRPKDEDSSSSLLERNSLLHLTLFMRDSFNSGLPPLRGDSYVIIPELLVPRLLKPDKIWSLEGTTRINIHFGLQNREDTFTTTIGWGLLNEGYANYGIWGMILVCILLGYFLGFIGVYSHGFSIFSFRILLAIMVLSVSIQTENTAGVYISTLFQTSIALSVFCFVFMKKLPHEEEFLFVLAPTTRKKNKRPTLSQA
jgi:hypothetical protein